MPKISVIVPIYNVAAYLPRCLDSILAQTEPDLEILLVDDGTPDESPAIMMDYAARDARIRCLRKENGGLSSARNAGMAEATGKYLLFVDADDWIAPTLAADAWQAAEAHGAEQVLWNYCRAFDDHTEPAYLPMRAEVLDLDALGLPKYFYRYWFPYVHGQEAWSKLYRRDIVEAQGLRFAPNREIFAEDTLFSAMYLLHTRKLVALDAPYVFYRQREDGLMGARKPQFARRLIELALRYADYARQIGRGAELRHVLPMLLYQLATKGLASDPSTADAAAALLEARERPALRALLRELEWGGALPMYLLHTGKGIRTQWRARAFAAAWLRGDATHTLRLAGRNPSTAHAVPLPLAREARQEECDLAKTPSLPYQRGEGHGSGGGIPLISIIVPCYNAASYLEACVASLCAQTLADFEAIIVNDGSTDGSREVADACAGRDRRVRVLHQANAGVSAARNAGLEAATGAYVMFCDADDTISPDALAALFAAIENNPALDIVSARHRERYPDGQSRVFSPGKRCKSRRQVLLRLIEGDSVYNSMCNKLYRREMLMRWRVRAQAGLRIGEDALFNLEAYARAGAVAHLPNVTYTYRIHGESAMRGIPAAEHYARHLPWLDGMRATLARLSLREAYFRAYCHSHALRLYKSRGIGGVLRDFNAEVRPVALEGIDPAKLRWVDKPMFAAVRAGGYAPVYAFAVLSALRLRDFAKRACRWTADIARRIIGGGAPCA